jgi:type I restriction enzyme, S subunit
MISPKLRFKNFDRSYSKVQLQEIGEFKNGINKDSESFGSGTPFINLMDVFGTSSIKKGNYGLVTTTLKERNEYNLLKGDVLFIRSSVKPSGVGLTAVVLEDLLDTIYSGFLIRFRDTLENLNLDYKKYCFYSVNFRKQLLKKATSSANTNINQESLKSLFIHLPSIEEQQQVGNFFGLIDNKIMRQKEKVDLLQKQKKGFLQKIFSQELRFKDEDNNNFPNWLTRKMGKVTKKVGPSNKKGANYAVCSVNNKEGFVLQSEQFENSRLDVLSKDAYKIVLPGEIAYNPARINVGSIGVQRYQQPVLISSLYVCVRFTQDVLVDFFSFFMETFDFKKQVILNTEGTVREYLFYENFSNINMPVPSLEEQKKIVRIMSKIELKIKNEEKKLNLLIERKKGLMAQMFI